MHGTGVFAVRLGLRRYARRSFLRFLGRVLLWCRAEPLGAPLTAEVDGGALMFDARRCFRGIDLHPAYGIVLFNKLHRAIVALSGHFDLSLSALGSST